MTIVIPGSKVTNSAGRSSTLGVFIFSEGTWYTFVPAHTFHANEKIRDGADGLVIGEVVTPPPYTENEPYPNISGALRLVRLFSYAPLRIGQQSRIRHVNPIDVVGQYLCKNETGSSVACGLAALGAQFTVEADGTTKTYSDAFVVKSKSSEVTLAKEGDGGAAISTGRDKLVGILVGVAGDALYCASAESVFARYFPDFESPEIAA